MPTADRTSVWYVLPRLRVGGTERTVVTLCNKLDYSDYDVHICVIRGPNPLESELDPGVTLHKIDASRKESILATIEFLRLVRQGSPEILQSFLTYGNIVAPLSAVFSSDMTVVTGIRAIPTDPNPVLERLEEVGLKRSDHVVSNSEAGKRYAVERGVDPSAVSVISNGRDVEAIGAASPASDVMSMTGDGPIVGTVGRLVERKGHGELLEAWPGVRQAHPSADVVIAGDGPQRESLERKARELGVADSVHLLGTREDIPAVLAALDVFVFPSHYEGLPGALIEAMAAGLPIVATPVDGNAELISDGESGVFVPPKSPVAITREVNRLLSDETHRKALGSAARTVAVERYSNAEMVRAFIALYERLSSNRSPKREH